MMKEEKNEDLVYIDQSGMDNRDVYEYGWGLKGQRIYGQRPGKKRERISIMSGYHLGKLVAPFTWIGSCNLQVLITWLTEMLLPTIGAGKKIVLDNASFHRCKLVRKVVETAGCELIYLPKYSPDLNPIEHPWHSIKQRVRKPMTSTTQHLHDLIDSAICFICQPLPA
jgi:transposase